MAESHNNESLLKLLVDTITHNSPLKDMAIVLKSGADPNGALTKGLRPVHYATYENHVQGIKMLVHFGADVNLSDNFGYTPMHIASKHGYVDAMETLLDNGALINYEDADETKAMSYMTMHPLNSAIENNQTKCVELLLKRGCCPNIQYFLGHEINLVPLEHLKCMELLLRYGADPDSVSRSGQTTLMKACREDNIDAVHLLLQYNADVNVQCPPRFDQKRALHFAVTNGSAEICRLLLEKGADPNIPPDYKHGPMETAITEGRPDVCTILLDHGANPNEINSEGSSLLQIASASCTKNQHSIIEVLLQYGAKPNYSSKYPTVLGPFLTPLVEYICNNDHLDIAIVRTLVRYGASINISQPTKLFKILDARGIIPQIRKLRPYESIFHLLIEVAEKFDFKAIKEEPSFSNGQKELLLERASQPRSLKHLTRLKIRHRLHLPVLKSANDLPLPAYMKEFLTFDAM